MDPVILAIIGVTLLVGGFVKGFSGFGTSIILTGILLFIFEPVQIIPVLAVLSFFMNSLLFFEHMKYMKDWRSNFAFRPETILSLIIGTYVGARLLIYLNVNLIKLLFGLMVIIFIYMIKHRITSHTHYHFPRRETNIIIGAISGFFSGLINVNGPPAVIYGMYHKYDKIKLLKSVVIFFMIADTITIGVFYLTGLFNLESLKLIIYFLPVLFAGLLFGKQLRITTTDHTFKKFVTFFLLVVAIKMVFEGMNFF